MKTPLIRLFPILTLVATNTTAATWDGSSSNLWNLAANWTPATVPNTTEEVIFPSAGGNKAMSNNRPSGTNFARLTFSGSGYTLTGQPLVLDDPAAASGTIQATHTSGTTTLNLSITLGEPSVISAVAGANIIFGTSSQLTHDANRLTLSGAGNFTLNGTSGGTGGVNVSTSGTVTIESNQNQSGSYNCNGSGDFNLNARVSGDIIIGANATYVGTAGRTFGACQILGDLDPGGANATTFSVDGDMSFLSDGTGEELFFDLNGTAAGSGYDRVTVGGTLTTDDIRIVLRPTTAFPLGTTFVLFNKTSAGAITHTINFKNSAGTSINEGSQQTVGVNQFQFSYAGGDGNDFTATVVLAPLGGVHPWDGGAAADLLWSSAANWVSDVVPPGGQILNFGNTATADVATVNDLGGNFGRIDFTGAVGGFTIAPESLTLFDLTLSDGIIASQSGAACAVNNDLVLGASQTFSLTGTANLTIGSGTSTQFNGFDLTVDCAPSSGTPQLALSSGLSGTGNLIKTGPGLVTIGGVGTSSNAYTGTTTVQEGELRLTRSTITAPANCIPGNLFIGGGANPASVTSTQTEKIADTATVTVNANGSFLPGATETIGGLILDGGTVNSSASVLSVDGNLTANQNATITSPILVKNAIRDWTVAAGKTFSLSGPLTYSPLPGGIAVNKKGDGTLILAGTSAVTNFSVDAGTLQLDNNSATDTIGVSLNGGTLAGSGRAVRISSAAAGGTLSPGAAAATAVFETTRLSLNAATTVSFDLNGTTAGTGHDQFDVAQSALDLTGTVILANAALEIRESLVAPVGSTFTIIRNDLVDLVSGTFNGVAQGAIFTTAFNRYSISYTGGTGNDVVLTVVAPASTGTTRVWDGGGGADTNWMTASNWTGDVAPRPGDSLEFPAVHSSSSNNFPAGMTFGSLSFTGAPVANTARSISGNSLQLLGNISSSLNDFPAAQVNISTPLTLLSAAIITNSGQRHLRFLAAMTTTVSPLRFAGDGSANQRSIVFTSAGIIGGPAGVIVEANAAANLGVSTTHTYGGGSEVKFGLLSGSAATLYPNGLTVGDGVNPATASVGNTAGSIPAAIVVNPRGTLNAGSLTTTSLTVNGTPANPATVTAQNVTLTTGFTTDTGDTVTMSSLAAPSLTQNGGALSITGAITIAGTARLQSGALGINGTSSAGTLQVDAGTLTQTGFLTVAGDVNVNGGTLTGAGIGFSGAGSHAFSVATTATLQTLGDAAFDDAVAKNGVGLLTVSTTLQALSVSVNNGTLQSDAANGNLTTGPATAIIVNGGHLRGAGTFGNISATAAVSSQISPGASPGRITTSGILVGPGQTVQLNFEVNAAVPATGFDQITVAGSSPIVSLAVGNNATPLIIFSPAFTAPIGTEMRLIDNQGLNPISGTFAGKPEGFVEVLSGTTVRYSYTGGTGNDFTITLLSAPPSGEYRVWDGGGADANWMTASNWVGNVTPLPGDALRFPSGATQFTNSNNFPADTGFNGLKIEADYTLNGSRILLTGNVDAQPPGAAVIALGLRLEESRVITLSGGGSLTRSGVTELAAAATLTLRNNSSGEMNVTGRIQPVAGVTTDSGVIMDGSGTGLVKLNVASGNTYTGETWVQRGVLEVTGVSSIEVPGNLRIGGAGFTATVDNPGGTTFGRIRDTADLIVETGGTHILTGPAPVERIFRLVMRGGSLVQLAGGQLIVDRTIRGEGGVASVITRPVFIEASSAADTGFLDVAAGSSLTFTASSGFLFGGAINPSLRKIGGGPLILQSSLVGAELDCWEGTVILSGPGGLISGTTILNGGTVTGNGTLNGLAKGVAAGVPAGSPGGGTLTPSGAAGTGTGLLTCAGNLLPVTVTHLAFELGGTTAITQYDQLQVNGTALDLNRCILDLSLINGFIPTAGQTFTLINKISGGSPTPRPFAGKDEGVTFTAAGQLWSLTYIGGDGNDVVLTALGIAPTLAITAFTFSPPPGGAAGKQVTATITGPASTLVNLEASSDLQIWTIIGSNSTSGAGTASFNITDSAAGDRRFYKFSIP